MQPLILDMMYQFAKIALLGSIKFPLLFMSSVLDAVPKMAGFVYLNVWDMGLFLINIFTPLKKKGTVVPKGKPGHGGLWPAWTPAGEDDSRAPCPYLNACANHGVIPHDGRNITMQMLGDVMCDQFNISKTLSLNTTTAVSGLFKGRKVIQLSDLGYHNIIEHDASLCRADHYFEPDSSVVPKDIVNKLLASATGPATKECPSGRLTANDIARYLVVREKHSLKNNPLFSLTFKHRFFGATNGTLMLEVAGGDVEALRTILLEERFPDGWETPLRQRCGFTMVEFHSRSAEIQLSRSDYPLGN